MLVLIFRQFNVELGRLKASFGVGILPDQFLKTLNFYEPGNKG